jgi:hypothetical protein
LVPGGDEHAERAKARPDRTIRSLRTDTG